MTAQINDRFRYHDTEYSIVGISEGEIFNPAVFGLKPVMVSTACWRGFDLVFAISDSHLVLDELNVSHMEVGDDYESFYGPILNGITPTGPEDEIGLDAFNAHYKGLNHRIEYTGGLLLAEGFIDKLYVHMGFHPGWKYKNVTELVFENGELKREFDRSEKMAQIRNMISEGSKDQASDWMPPKNHIEFIEKSFDRTYATWSE